MLSCWRSYRWISRTKLSRLASARTGGRPATAKPSASCFRCAVCKHGLSRTFCSSSRTRPSTSGTHILSPSPELALTVLSGRDITSCYLPKVDAHVASTIAAKPKLVQISTGYTKPQEGSAIVPRGKYVAIASEKPKDKEQA